MNIIELYDCKDTTMEQKDYKSLELPALLLFDYQDIYNSFVKALYADGYKINYCNNLKNKFDYDKDNKTIKRIVSLGQRKNRSKYGEYIVEGIRSIRDISTMGVIKAIVIRESKCKDKNIEALLSLESMQLIPTYIAQDPVFDKIDNTVNGQGIVAIVSKPKHNMESISIEDGVYITLDGVQDPGNLGTIIRTAVAAGVMLSLFN